MNSLGRGLLTAAVACLCAPAAHPCTTFCLDGPDGPVVGKSYDWDNGAGLVLVNKRNVRKVAVPLGLALDHFAHWTSKYGSITFNQYGRELPCGGINEAGLMIEVMWLDETVYPERDARKALTNLQWIQYQLDNHATVAEVIASDQAVRIQKDCPADVHFLACDRTGACVTVEMLDGQTVMHTGADLPARVLTNSTYRQSAAYLRRHKGFGGDAPLPEGGKSLARFVRAAARATAYDAGKDGPPLDYALATLDCVHADRTQWNIVYDQAAGRVYFRTAQAPKLRHFELDGFDYACSSPVLMLDMNADLEGNVTERFTGYAFEANLALVQGSFGQLDILKGFGALLEQLARYPETCPCAE